MSNENVNINNVQAIKSRREEFQTYLQRNGVTECISDLLMSLYKKDERPDDVFEYVRNFLSTYRKDDRGLSKIEILKRDLIEAKSKVKDLKKKINRIENKMANNSNQVNNINVAK